MSNEDLRAYFADVGLRDEVIQAPGGQRFIVGRGYRISKGSLVGVVCDVAIQWSDSVPYVAPPAIHTRPLLIPMGTLNTQASNLGPDWQYWSRTLRVPPTPKAIVAHIATVLGEV